VKDLPPPANPPVAPTAARKPTPGPRVAMIKIWETRPGSLTPVQREIPILLSGTDRGQATRPLMEEEIAQLRNQVAQWNQAAGLSGVPVARTGAPGSPTPPRPTETLPPVRPPAAAAPALPDARPPQTEPALKPIVHVAPPITTPTPAAPRTETPKAPPPPAVERKPVETPPVRTPPAAAAPRPEPPAAAARPTVSPMPRPTNPTPSPAVTATVAAAPERKPVLIPHVTRGTVTLSEPVENRPPSPPKPAPAGPRVATGIVTFHDEPAPAAPNTRTPLDLRKCIEAACEGGARDIEVIARPGGSLRIQFKVANPADATRLSEKVLHLPDLAMFDVSLDIEVTTP
jgi:hypothetical protein